jgi:non-specific serine/threonine protein kinase
MDAERWRRITLLYLEALALTTEERVAFLGSACGDDSALRRELESLLDGGVPAPERLTTAATVTLAEVGPSAESVSTVAAGQVLGSYRIEGLLGRGGMASVYLAHDLKHRRTVAIKVLKSQIAAAVGTVRFLREIEIAAQLVHPHILPLFDSGAVGDHLFYVMPHVEGGSLRARLQHDAPLPLDEALRLAREVARALGHAHGQGFIHRDIKPENILLSDGMALVADFGIARVMSASGVEKLTGTGAALGTPLYMSPEQALDTGSVGAPADLYSLACVLYEMLAGEPPFTGSNVMTVLSRHLAGAVPPLSEKRPGLPDGIERVIEKALAKAPGDRYATAAQFAEALIAAAMGTPIPAASTAPHAIPHNLPPQRTSFVGRETELQECARLVLETRLLTLTGIGGCGKTRLALKLAETLLASYPDGVWFVDLAPLSQRSGVVDALALALGVRGEPGRELTDTLCRWVRGQRVLLVLDNCEHVLDSTRELVDALLGAGNELRILITSREGLGIDGERAFPVPSLPVPMPESADDLQAVEASAAVRLFVDRARIVDPSFALTMENAAGVADICRRLDGIPLAIELAAPRVKLLSVEDIRVKLDDRFRLLTGGRNALPRHQTLWSVFEWSYDHLAPDEQRLFRLLSVFADGWTMAAATAVSSEVGDEFEILDLLTRLVDKSLVVVERVAPERVRYRLLETSRQFAQQKLHDAGEGEAERRRHLEYFARWAEAREPLAVGPQRGEWLVDMEREHQNVHAALEWSDAATGGAEPALRLVAAVWRYWPTRGLSALGRERLTQALGRPGAEAPTAARARALSGAGRLAQRQGALAEARVLLEESLSLCNGFGDHTGMARALNNLGLVCSQQGDHDGARARFEESLALARETGDRRGASMCLNNLAEQSRERGDLKSARPQYEDALAEARLGGDPGNIALCLQNLAILLLQDGDPEGAGGFNLEALRIVRDLGLRALGVGVVEVAGGLALASGDLANGIRLGAASLALFQAMGITRDPMNARMQAHFMASVLPLLGTPAFAQARIEGAALSYEAALEEAEAWLES